MNRAWSDAKIQTNHPQITQIPQILERAQTLVCWSLRREICV